jgi:acyl-CoA synthetase (NDP forming)
VTKYLYSKFVVSFQMKQLNLDKSLRLLKKYHLPFTKHLIIKSESNLKKIEYPVVLKLFSENIIHKSDSGLVKTNIQNIKDATKAWKELKKYKGDIIAQKMVSGKEIVVGIKNDVQFGPIIMFGLGGIAVEVTKDVSFRMCPINKKQALEMIKEIKSYKMLEGIRGEKKSNINAIAEIITKLSKLASKEKIRECDLNPVIVNEKNAEIVDVRFLL